MRAITVWAKKESDSTWLEIVPLQGESFNLSKKLIDLEEIDMMRCDASKTLYFPAENSLNNSFFSNFANFNTAHTFNPFDFYECKVLTATGSQLLIGTLYLVDYDQRKKLYQCNIASKIGTIKQRLGDSTLEVLPAYNHLYNWENIKSSWANNTGWQKLIKYMPIDNGVGVGEVTNINVVAGDVFKMFYPGVNLKETVKDSFAHLGFNFVDLTGTPDDAFVAMGGNGNKDVLAPTIVINSNVVGTVINNETTEEPLLVNLATGNAVGYYPTGGYFEVFQILKSGTYIFSNNIRVINNTGVNINTNLLIYTGTTADNVTTLFYSSNEVTITSSEFYQDLVYTPNNYELELDGGVFIKYVLQVEPWDEVPGTSLSILSPQTTLFLSAKINVTQYLKQLKLYDLIQIYRKLYDVYFIFNQPQNRFEAHTYATLTTAGASVDWTNKIEYKSEFKSGSLINYIAAKYVYLVKQTKNLIDVLTFSKDGLPLGAFELYLPINSQQPEQKSEVITSTWVNSRELGYSFYKNYEKYGDPKQNDVPKVIGFFCEEEGVNTYNVIDETGVTVTYNKIGRFENVRNGLILAFNRIDQYAGNDGNSGSQSLYKAFHHPKFAEWIGMEFTDGVGATLNTSDLINARIVTTQVWLTQSEFSALTLGERVTINTPLGTQYFRILEVSNFNATGNSPCNVKLIRIL